jgi:hypothetical protein
MNFKNTMTLNRSALNPILRFVIACNFLFVFSFFANAQQAKIETGNFFVTNYSRSYLNSISGNWALLQDPDGVIYIANTYNGISTYDGQKIRRVLNNQGLPKLGLTRSIISDSKNIIYTIIGAFLWPLIVCGAGFYVGQVFPQAIDYLNYIIIGFIVVTSIPVIKSLTKKKIVD